MLCVSLANLDFERCKAALGELKLAEIRLDQLNFNRQEVEEIFSLPVKLVATCRPGGFHEAEREALLQAAVAHGAAFVDIEIEAPDSFKQAIIAAARRKKCRVIISYHDYEKTPPAAELKGIIARCFADGADIAKIACQVRSEGDCARIMGLYDREPGDKREIIAFGMGERGRITRIAAALLGAPFTYTALFPGGETAPGQLDKETLGKILDLVR
jgi:3-dehydroquinate dehydratase-1